MRGETRLSFRMSAAAFHRAADQGSLTLPVDPTPPGDEPLEAKKDGMIPSSTPSGQTLPAPGHGSEKRARTIHLGVRLTPEERAQIERAAESSVVLDELGYLPLAQAGGQRLFHLVSKLYERTSVKPECATILAQLACYQGALPQGSPCSPIISDLVARILDQRLARFAKLHRVTYSRYADDITFSTNAKSFPPAIATGGTTPDDPWVLAGPLIGKIEGSGFAINHGKTRMQVSTSRQMVTGLTVNEKVNISQTYWRGVRSMCHSLFKTGSYYRPGADSTNPDSIHTSLRPLRGALGHVFHVKSQSHIRPVGEPWSQKKPPMIFGQRTHEDFYFYDYFVALEHPLIVTEGLTDPVYLRNAIRRLPAFHPQLGARSASGFDYKVRFFNYENTIHRLMRMGGSDALKTLAVTYEKRLARYAHQPLRQPVIFLLDNDAGLTKFSSAVLNTLGKTINLTTTEAFYHLVANLYVVKTPEPGGGGHSCIEDLFGADKDRPLAGKVLHLDEKTFDSSKHISKAVFAKKVIAKEAGLVNWAGFEPLLSRVVAVLNDYHAPPLASAVAGPSPTGAATP